MKVHEAIDQLKKLPPDQELLISDSDVGESAAQVGFIKQALVVNPATERRKGAVVIFMKEYGYSQYVIVSGE